MVKIGIALIKERCVWPQDMQAFQVISISIIHFFAIMLFLEVFKGLHKRRKVCLISYSQSR